MLPDDVIRPDRAGDDDREWVVLERTEPCTACGGTKFSRPQFLGNRNYDVFSILANVRNGYGFAGVVTSSGFNPITNGRGIPDDLSEEIRANLKRQGYDLVDGGLEYHRDREEEDDLYETMEREPEGCWSLGEHSFTWVTLQEIFDFDWSQTITKTGWVDPVEFLFYREHGYPESYCGGVSGRGVEHITEMEMVKKIDDGEILFEDVEDPLGSELGLPATRKRYTTGLQRAMGGLGLPEGSTGAAIRDRTTIYCPIKWEETYAQCVGASFWQELEYLREQAPDGDMSNVRLVMGFDS